MGTSPAKDQVGVSGDHQVLEVDLEALYGELSALGDDGGEGLHRSEIESKLGLSERAAVRFIHRAIKAGVCTPTRKPKRYIDGRISNTAAYIFHSKEEEEDAA